VPRATRGDVFWRNALEIIRLSDKYRCTGILILTGNEIAVEPWLLAHAMAANSEFLEPLVAVNPVYMHPFTTARMIGSLGLAYKRRVYLNLVTGTSLSHLQALGDGIAHDERYARLLEYTTIVTELLSGQPLSYEGKYYSTKGLQLLPALPKELHPRYLVAGQSAAAVQIAEQVGAVNIQMLGPTLDSRPGAAKAIHFGVTCRASETEAWSSARQRFPEDKVGQFVLDESMKNTDSEWKRRLQVATTQESTALPGFWMMPFRNFQADCPFFVGDHDRTAEMFAGLVRSGIRTFVLDVPLSEEDFEHTAAAFQLTARLLNG